MTNRESKYSRPSTATHHVTQASTTLNRRYVKRPQVITVQRTNSTSKSQPATKSTSAKSSAFESMSRLVNLVVHASQIKSQSSSTSRRTDRNTPTIRQASQSKQQSNLMTAKPTEAKIPKIAQVASEKSSKTTTIAINRKPTANVAPNTTAKTPKQRPQAAETPQETVISRTNQDNFATNIALNYASKRAASASTNSAKVEPVKVEQSNSPVSQSESMVDVASKTIASIRTATPPEAVSVKIDALKTFADQIKSQSSTPESAELSDTIEKFVTIAQKSSKLQPETSTQNAPKAQKVVEQPVDDTKSLENLNQSLEAASTSASVQIKQSPRIVRAAYKTTPPQNELPIISKTTSIKFAEPVSDRPAEPHPLQTVANRKLSAKKTPQTSKPTSKEIKERALKQAIRSVATMDEKPATAPIKHRKKSGAKRFILALACASACLVGVIYFVSNNIPDVSVRVAAMQTGIEATYPSYVPMNYSLSDIISEEGKITMIFAGPEDASFTLIEEKSSWDSATLLRNFVEPTWGQDYVTTHEQGITIYISSTNSDAAWVNGGILYKITSSGKNLTKKQVRNIVLSL